MNESRKEFLDLALSCGAKLTGNPDGSEAVTVVFTVDAWRAFDAACLTQALATTEPEVMQDGGPPCKRDPRAPHGFLRDTSHAAGRYVCECEFWEPPATPEPEAASPADMQVYDKIAAGYWTERKGPLSKDQIREVFLAHGFTIKEGQTDLKPYVYDAAYALLTAAKKDPS